LTPKGALAKAGTDIVNTKTFYYSDDSNSGVPKVDSKTVYLSFDYAQKLCGMDGSNPRTTAVYISFTDGTDLNKNREKVKLLWNSFLDKNKDKKYANLLENVTVQTWNEYRRSSIAPMEKEQTMLTLAFIMLGVITVFIIAVVFYMIISHKSKDIGIFKSIGISNFNIIRIFLGFAFAVGLIGSAIGSVAGWAFLSKVNEMEDWLFENFDWQLWDRSVYAIGDIPGKVDPQVLTTIIISAIAAALIGALLPAIQTAKKRPVETLQVNQL
jgi:ABC-type lipoprotein release transport system permease subunit